MENKEYKESDMYRNPLAKSKIGNDPCICGSGKKIKKCHGFKQIINGAEMQFLQDLYQKRKSEMSDAFRATVGDNK